MAKQLLVLDEEVIAMLQAISAPNRIIDAFRKQASAVLEQKGKSEKGYDEVWVNSGYGATSRHGFVDLTLNETRTQLATKKAREIGLMLIEAAEAAESDEIIITFLEKNLPDLADGQRGHILLELREIRHGSKNPLILS